MYGLTLYSAFLGEMLGSPVYLVVLAVVLAGVGFCAVSTWALTGASIRAYLNRPLVKRVLNIGLSLLLVYTAVELSGILGIL